MRIVKRLTQVSGTVLRLAMGAGGAALVFLALKDKVKRGKSTTMKPNP